MVSVNWLAFAVFMLVVASVTMLGFWAARWYAGNLDRLQEWGLAGRRFGTVVSWFLLGGDIYTAQAMVGTPGLIFAQGALGFSTPITTIVMYTVFFSLLPRFWTLSRHRGYITSADFVRERFDSPVLALLIAITGIVALTPYIAVQILGMEVAIAQMGIPVEASLIIAFLVLSLFTYFSGLRAPALMAMAKDAMLWLVIVVAIIYIPLRLGGFEHVFSTLPRGKLYLTTTQYSAYTTLNVGAGLALFLYPHTLTGVLSSNSRKVVKRNAVLLPLYGALISLSALLAYMAIAAGIHPSATYQSNSAIPALFSKMFPSWFAGFAFATISIGALIPAAIMSIAAANLFTRNIYRVYLRPECTEQEEARIAKLTSLFIKFGAFLFILLIPTVLISSLYQFSNIIILQTLPAVFLGLQTNWFHRHALIIGWVTGMVIGIWIPVSHNLASTMYVLSVGGVSFPLYAGIFALGINLILSTILTPLFKRIGLPRGEDATLPEDFQTRPVRRSRYPQTAIYGKGPTGKT